MEDSTFSEELPELPTMIQFPPLLSVIESTFPIGANPYTLEADRDSHAWFAQYGIPKIGVKGWSQD